MKVLMVKRCYFKRRRRKEEKKEEKGGEEGGEGIYLSLGHTGAHLLTAPST